MDNGMIYVYLVQRKLETIVYKVHEVEQRLIEKGATITDVRFTETTGADYNSWYTACIYYKCDRDLWNEA